MPPSPGCPRAGPPSPEVTGAFCRVPSTSFSQAPRYSLPIHLCRFRVRSISWSYFLEHLHCKNNPISSYNIRHSSLPAGPGILTWFPSTTAFALALGPAHPAQISFTQEPLDFRRQCLSHCLSLLVSAFSLPIPPGYLAVTLHWLTERSATM